MSGEGLFQVAFAAATRRPELRERLDVWVIRYGFCRNVCFTALLGIVAIPILCLVTADWQKLWLLAVAVGVSVGMFYRYLRIHRQYSYELFMAYVAEDQ